MGWAVWLAVPVGATSLAAVWAWLRGWAHRRKARPLDTEDAVRAHSRYLDTLVIPAASASRPARVEDPAGGGTDPAQ